MIARLLLLIYVGLFCSVTLAQRTIETTGSAPINAGAKIMAREQAIKNAMQQALLQTSAHISSTSTISSNVLIIDSARVNTSGTVENVKILEEWSEEDIYFVRIRASIPDNSNEKLIRGAHYRKKIAAIQFDITHRTQIYDLPDIERKLPRELLARLDNTGNFITIDGTEYLVSKNGVGYEFDNPAVYQLIGKVTGAQIILSGSIRNMSVEEGFFQDKRHLEIEIYLHDGLSGARIARHRFSETVTNAGSFKKNHDLFSNASFTQNIYGMALNRIMNTQIELIRDDLKTIPFTAKIIRINGKTVLFDAGTRSRIRTGDMLMTFKREADPLENSNSDVLGYVESPVASLSVDQVQSQFSSGQLEIKNSKLMPGDLIRFGR